MRVWEMWGVNTVLCVQFPIKGVSGYWVLTPEEIVRRLHREMRTQGYRTSSGDCFGPLAAASA